MRRILSVRLIPIAASVALTLASLAAADSSAQQAKAPEPPPTVVEVAKAGVATLTMAMAEEAAKDGILVNAVAPSIMDTAANRASMPKAHHDAWPKVEEVAATIVFLASADADYIVAQTLNVDGGNWMS